LSARVIDQHPVTLEFAADKGAGRVNCTGKTMTVPVLLKKNAFFPVVIVPSLSFLFIFFRNGISIFR
jgi:hypothetical protein